MTGGHGAAGSSPVTPTKFIFRITMDFSHCYAEFLCFAFAQKHTFKRKKTHKKVVKKLSKLVLINIPVQKHKIIIVQHITAGDMLGNRLISSPETAEEKGFCFIFRFQINLLPVRFSECIV